MEEHAYDAGILALLIWALPLRTYIGYKSLKAFTDIQERAHPADGK